MNRHIAQKLYLFVLVLALLAAFVHPSLAAVNQKINYQGKLTGPTGSAVANGTYNMRFWLLTTPSIATTSAVWTESLTGSNKVQVTNGLFSVMLGSTTSLANVNFNQTLYLGVEIGGTASPAWDGEMSPRKVLGTVPAAFEAKRLEGLASTSFVRTNKASTIASSTSSTLLTITQNGTGNILDLFDAATPVFTVRDGGNIGIGTSTPSQKLQVQGGFRLTGGFYDSTNVAGTNGMVLRSTGTSTRWVATSTLGFSSFGGTVDPNELSATDFGSFTCNGTTCTVDANSLTASMIGNGDHGFFSYSSNVASLDANGLTSANLISAVSDETGSGALVFGTAPTLASTTITGRTKLSNASTTNLTITSKLYDNSNSAGTNGMVLKSTGTGFAWVATSSLGFAGASIFTDAGANTYLTSLTDNLLIGTTTNTSSNNKLVIRATDFQFALVNASNNRWGLSNWDGTNGLYFQYNGSNKMFLSSAGNLGIGTTTVNQALSLFRNGSDAAIEFSTVSGANEKWSIGVDDSDGTKFKISSSSVLGTNDRFVIDGRGSVGIGTSSPTAKLDVVGEVRATTQLQAFAGGTGFNAILNTLGVHSNAWAQDLTFYTTNGSGVSNSNQFVLNGTNANVGIGTSTPAKKLSIAGDIRLTGALYDSVNSAGTSGNILKSTATGQTWVATSTLGFLSTTSINTSAKLANFISNETGTGALVFGTAPTLSSTTISGIVKLSSLTASRALFTDAQSRATTTALSAYLSNALTDETGTGGVLVFATNPTLAGATLSSTLTLSGSAANIALGSNYLSGDGGDEGVYVDSTGRVGIGTTTPARELQVHTGNDGGGLGISYTDSAASYGGVDFFDTTSGHNKWSFGANADSYSVSAAQNAFYVYQNYDKSESSVNAYRLFISDSGNVGIGTTTPAKKLSVVGDLRLTGALFDTNNSAGTSGYILQSTATGQRWVATSTLGAGAVSSVAMTVPTGLTVTGSPITNSGTLAVSYSAGYAGVLTASTTQWNTFYITPSARISDGTGLTWSSNTLNCDTASGSIQGCLTSSDWTSFNGRIASSSLNTSAKIATLVSDETGSGALVFGTAPTLASTTITGRTKLSNASTTNLTITSKLYDNSNSAGAAGSVLRSTGSGFTWSATSSLGFLSTTSINTSAKLANFISNETGTGALVFGTAPTLSSTTISGILKLSGQTASRALFTDSQSRATTTALSALLANSITDETGSGSLVFSNAPTFTGHVKLATTTATGTFTTVGSFRNIGAYPNFTNFDTAEAYNGIDLRAKAISGYAGVELNMAVLNASSTAVPLFALVSEIGNINASTTRTFSIFDGSGARRLIINSAGSVGIGTSSPSQKLHVQGNLRVTGSIVDNNNTAGTNGMVLKSTGTGFAWVSTTTLGFGGGLSTSSINTSAKLAAIISNETGSGSLVFGIAPTLSSTTISGILKLSGQTASRALFTDSQSRATTTALSASLLNSLTDETGSGVAVFGTAPTLASTTITGRTKLANASTTNLTISSKLFDNSNSAGTNGMVLKSTGTGFAWVATSTLGLMSTIFTDAGANTYLTSTSDYFLLGTTTNTASNHKLVVRSSDHQLALVNTNNNIWGLTNWDGTSGLYFQYNGTNRMFLSSTGNLGIGTTSPTARLTVETSGQNGILSAVDNQYDFAAFVNKSASNKAWSFYGGTNGSLRLWEYNTTVASSTGNVRMAFAPGGNIGIGTTTPNQKLSIFASTTDPAIEFSALSGPSKKWTIGIDISDGNKFKISSSSALGTNDRFVIDGAGRVGIGVSSPNTGSLLDVNGVVRMKYVTDPGAYSAYIGGGIYFTQYSTSLPNVYLSAFENGAGFIFTNNNGSTELMRVAGSGNVGIGTSTPNQRLTIFKNAADAAIEFSRASGTTKKWTLGADDSDGGKFKISSSSALGTNDRFVIDGQGYVGIGTSTPVAKLNVWGTGELLRIGDDTTSASNIAFQGGRADVGYINNFAVLQGGVNKGIKFIVGQTQFGSGYTAMTIVGDSTGPIPVGNVGIGTTTPNQKLSIFASTTDPSLGFSALSGPSKKWTLGIDISDGNKFKISSSSVLGTNDRFVIDGAGNVGVGTSTPANTLTVAGTQRTISSVAGNYVSSIYNLSSTGYGLYIYDNNTLSTRYALGIDNSTGGIFRVTNAGNVGIGTSSPNRPLHIYNTNAEVQFTNSNTPGTSWQTGAMSGGRFAITQAGIGEWFTISSGGKVGISSSTPAQELSVSGDLLVTGRIYDSSNSAGTNGMVLKSTGTGFTWVATSTLGLTGGASLITDGGATSYLTATGDNFAIGTTTSNQKLAIFNNAADAAILLSSASGATKKWTLGIDASDGNKFKISSSSVLGTNDRFVIDGNGWVGINTSTPGDELSVVGSSTSQIIGISATNNNGGANGTAAFYIQNFGVTAPFMQMNQANGTSLSRSPTVNGDWIGYIQMQGYGTSGYVGGAQIITQAEATFTNSSAPSNIQFSVGGTGGPTPIERMRLNSSGNLGIGTQSPNQRLSIFGTSTDPGIEFSANSGGTNKWSIGLDVSDGGKFKISSSSVLGTNDRLIIDGEGNVGIGTSSPDYKLTVQSPFASIGYISTFTRNSKTFGIYSSNLGVEIGSLTTHPLAFFTDNGTPSMVITTSNKIGIGTSTPNQPLSIFRSVSDAAIEFSTAIGSSEKWTMGVDISDGTKFKISSSSVLGTNDRFVIDGAGRVGIGSSTPISKLTVVGTAGSTNDVFSVASSTNTKMFTVKSNGFVGIGTANPVINLTVSANSATLPVTNGAIVQYGAANGVAAGMYIDSFANSSEIDFRRANTTALNPSVVFNDESLGKILWKGYGSTGYLTTSAAKIEAVASETWSDSTGGAYLTFSTRPSGTGAPLERMRLTASGKIGIGTTTPNQQLSIFNSGADAAIEFSTLSGANEKWTIGIDDSDKTKFKISSSSALGTNDRFVINGKGYVGIGTSSPAFVLNVINTDTSIPRGIVQEQYSNDNSAALFGGRHARGTPTSKSAVQNNDFIASFGSESFDGTNFQTGGFAAFQVAGTVAGGSVPTDYVVYTGANLGGIAERTRVTSAGRFSIGTSTSRFKLNVADASSTGYVANIVNTNTANTADGLLISLGVANASRGTGNYFVGFAQASGNTVAGKIQGGASAVAYTTTAADLAEFFPVEDETKMPKAGEIVALDPSHDKNVVRATGEMVPFGIVSTNPGFVGNGPICKISDNSCDSNFAKDNALVSLIGQVPLKVSNENGPITAGDSITISSKPGVGMKARFGDVAIGYALEGTDEHADSSTIWVYTTRHSAFGMNPDPKIYASSSSSSSNDEFTSKDVINRLVQLAHGFVDGVLSTVGVKTEKVDTSTLCVGDVCVDEATFLKMVQQSEHSNEAPTPDPEPIPDPTPNPTPTPDPDPDTSASSTDNGTGGSDGGEPEANADLSTSSSTPSS